MGLSRLRLGVAALAIASALAGLGCQSPTLPLPPPSEPDYTTPANGHTDIIGAAGSAIPGALVMAFNDDTGTGSIVTAGPHGEFSVRVDVDFSQFAYNTIEIWQRTGRGDSSSISKLIHDPTKP